MYLLPGNPFSHAVEAYRVSGEARCPNYLQQLPVPFSPPSCVDASHTAIDDDEYARGKRLHF